ncbi:MAG: hypothetical protein KDD66_17250, partial [Bdellovibrionales bacterium]|nr:hypothetical protein [Bdellovibrionales bacterium]
IDGECNYGSEQLHNSVSNAHGYNCFATVDATEASEQLYTFYSSAGAENQFGCVAIKKKKNCILNTEYSESEYKRLKQKLIAHMKDTGEWGKFFPASMSPFYFQETAGYTYFPLTEEEAKRRSLNWRKESPSAADLAGVNAVDAAALDALTLSERKGAAVKCEVSGRPFKLTLAELKMYEKLGALVPTDHPDERHKRHVHSRGGFELFERFCEQTGEPILTTYSPDTPFVIWSNSAYAEEFDS